MKYILKRLPDEKNGKLAYEIKPDETQPYWLQPLVSWNYDEIEKKVAGMEIGDERNLYI